MRPSNKCSAISLRARFTLPMQSPVYPLPRLRGHAPLEHARPPLRVLPPLPEGEGRVRGFVPRRFPLEPGAALQVFTRHFYPTVHDAARGAVGDGPLDVYGPPFAANSHADLQRPSGMA